MATGFELAKAFVTLSTQGLSTATRNIEQLAAEVDKFRAREKQVGPLLDYSRMRGLDTARVEAIKLVEIMERAGSKKHLDAWIDEQVELQKRAAETEKHLQRIAKWRDAFPSLANIPAPAGQPTTVVMPPPTPQPTTVVMPTPQPAPRPMPQPDLMGGMKPPTALLEALEQLDAKMESSRRRAASLSVLSSYANSRGLHLAGQDAEILGKKLEQFASLKSFDKWIDGQRQFRDNMDRIQRSVRDVTQFSAWGFAAATASITGWVQAASPAHWATLSGSIQLVSASIGTMFLPYVEQAIDYVQDLYYWFKELDPETKKSIASWTMWGVAGMAALVFVPRLLGMLSPLLAVYRVLNGTLALGTTALYGWASAAGTSAANAANMTALMSTASATATTTGTAFATLGAKIRSAGSAMLGFMAANPAGVVLAAVGAIYALSKAFQSAADSVETLNTRMDRMDQLADEIRGGAELNSRRFREIFATTEEEARQGGFWAQFQDRIRAAGRDTPQFHAIVQEGIQNARAEVARGRVMEEVRERIRSILERPEVRDIGSFDVGPGETGAMRRRRYIIEGGEDLRGDAERLYRSGALGSSSIFNPGGGMSQSSQEIERAVRSIDANTSAAAARLATLERLSVVGQVPESERERAKRNRLVNPNPGFQSQLMAADQAWRRVQMAVASGNTIEQEQRRIMLENAQKLAENTRATTENTSALAGGVRPIGPQTGVGPVVPQITGGSSSGVAQLNGSGASTSGTIGLAGIVRGVGQGILEATRNVLSRISEAASGATSGSGTGEESVIFVPNGVDQPGLPAEPQQGDFVPLGPVPPSYFAPPPAFGSGGSAAPAQSMTVPDNSEALATVVRLLGQVVANTNGGLMPPSPG